MNNGEDGYERFNAHMRTTMMTAWMLVALHTCLKVYEKDPSKPFSDAFANASFGYISFQLAHLHLHAFPRRAVYPRFLLFDLISLFFLFATIIISFAAIFFN